MFNTTLSPIKLLLLFMVCLLLIGIILYCITYGIIYTIILIYNKISNLKNNTVKNKEKYKQIDVDLCEIERSRHLYWYEKHDL